MTKDDQREARKLVYRPPRDGEAKALDATIGVKFSQGIRFLDPWGFKLKFMTRRQRVLFRFRHPFTYIRRWWFFLSQRIKRIFVKDPPSIMCRKWITKEEALKIYPNKEKLNGNNQKQADTPQQNQRNPRGQPHR